MRPSRALVHLPLLVWSLLCLFPFVLIVMLSFRDSVSIFTHPLGNGGTFRPRNYVDAWNGPPGASGMAGLFRNSAIVTVAALAVNIVLGTSAAYFIVGLRARLRAAVLGVFLLGQALPFVLLILPYFRLFQFAGLLNSPAALGVVIGALFMPTTVLILYAHFRRFPAELREAACIDGLGGLRSFVHIALPVSIGPIAAVTLMNFVAVWSETQLAIVVLRSTESKTVPVGVLAFRGLFLTDYGPLFATLTIAVVPVLLIFLLFNRTLTRGVQLSGSAR